MPACCGRSPSSGRSARRRPTASSTGAAPCSTVSTTSISRVTTCGDSASTMRTGAIRQRSRRTTAGSSAPSRPPTRRSRRRRSTHRSRPGATSSTRCRLRRGPVATPTPWRPSPGRCSVPAGAPRPCRCRGAGCSMAGAPTTNRPCAASISRPSPGWLSVVGTRTRPDGQAWNRWSATTPSASEGVRWCARSTARGSATRQGCRSPSSKGRRRWCRCAAWATPMCLPTSSTSPWRCSTRRVADNSNLELVLADTARTVAELVDAGERVFVHCVAAENRTPAVAAAYLMVRGADRDTAVARAASAARQHATGVPGRRPRRAQVVSAGITRSAKTSSWRRSSSIGQM